MSVSLVKKSIELSTTEDRSTDVEIAAKTDSKKLKLKRKRAFDEKKNAAIIVKKIREKTLTDSKVNTVELNVQKLLNLSKSNTIHKKLENKLLDKVNPKKAACDNIGEQKTGFTEEDFINFEREYFAN